MISKSCKLLAEVDLSIAEVSRHEALKKSTRHGHSSTLHLQWARRPLTSSQAILPRVEERHMAKNLVRIDWKR
jgi:adenine-specific DNA methylase